MPPPYARPAHRRQNKGFPRWTTPLMQTSLVNDAEELMKRIENFKAQKGARDPGATRDDEESLDQGIERIITAGMGPADGQGGGGGVHGQGRGGAPAGDRDATRGPPFPRIDSIQVMTRPLGSIA